MKWVWTQLVIVVLGVVPRVARAQGMNPPMTSLLTLPADSAPSAGPHGAIALLILTAVATVVLLAIAKASDFRRKREDQTAELEVRISTALLEHPAFFRSSVVPRVRIPFWRGSPATITMAGDVPSSELAQTALRLATQAASWVRSDFTIENRIIVATASGHAAPEAKGDVVMAKRFVSALKTLTSIVGVMTGIVLLKYAFLVEHLNLK
jgi:hypothetical protein